MEQAENTCPVCSEHIDIYAVGACDHPICYKCSTRMRVLCEQMYCPICRTNLPQVVLVNENDKFESFNRRGWQSYRKCNTFFQDKDIKSSFFELLDHKCALCKDRPPDRYLQDLSRHMRREHEKFFCDLCVEHLKIFTFERKHYDRRGLATHRREGDPDDPSYKGHPLCRFCDVRYLDNDELSRHLRKDHYYCHFCDTDGSNQFYSEYAVLMEHFREDHYLCDEGECASAQFTHAFRSEIDFKAHKANCHSKGTKRSFTKQARTLDVEFALAPRKRPERNYRDYDGSGRGGRASHYGRDRYSNNHSRQEAVDPEMAQALEASRTEAREQEKQERRERRDQVSRQRREEKVKEEPKPKPVEDFQHDSESFPSLSGKSSPTSEIVVPADRSDTPPVTDNSLAQKLALSERHTVRTTAAANDDFPALGKAVGSNNAQWVKGRGRGMNTAFQKDYPALSPAVKPVRSAVQSAPKPQAPKPQAPKPVEVVTTTPKPVQPSQRINVVSKRDLEDFPGLPAASKPLKSRKAPTEGPWVSKTSNEKVSKTINRQEKPSKKEPAKVSSTFTLADVGKALHNDSYPALGSSMKSDSVDSVKTASQKAEKEKTNGSEKKAKNKKKKKEKVESATEEFSGYPECKVEKVETQEPVESKVSASVNDKELNKENNAVKNSGPRPSAPVVRSSDKPWVLQKSDKLPWTMVDSLEDFPHLSETVELPPSAKPPPGFSTAPASKPPPGFSCKISPSRPPPGLVKPVLSPSNDIQSTDLMNITNVDITNIQHTYSKPDNFSERNKSLITEIRSSLNNDGDKFNSFKCWSGEFRQGSLSAKKYYEQCLDLFGRDRLSGLFAELLVLLPDIPKQQELLHVHTSGAKSGRRTGWNTSASAFITCPVCRQVLILADEKDHLACHNMESDFPTLSHTDGHTGPGLNAWVRAT